MEAGDAIGRVGVEAGDADQEFGDIVDMTADSGCGSIHLLDAAAHTVRVFGLDGAARVTFAREGRGPGELAAPESIVHDQRETLFVLDGANGR